MNSKMVFAGIALMVVWGAEGKLAPPKIEDYTHECKKCGGATHYPKSGSSSECENAISCPLFMTGCKEMKTGCKHANDRPFGPLGGPGAVFTCSHPCTSPVWRVSRDRAA